MTLDLICNSIGDRKIGSSVDGIDKVQFSKDLLITGCIDPIEVIVKSIYQDFDSNYNDIGYL